MWSGFTQWKRCREGGEEYVSQCLLWSLVDVTHVNMESAFRWSTTWTAGCFNPFMIDWWGGLMFQLRKFRKIWLEDVCVLQSCVGCTITALGRAWTEVVWSSVRRKADQQSELPSTRNSYLRYKKKLVSSIDSPQENIGDELLCDENSSTDDNFENVEFDDDKISISSVEETSKMLAKRKFVPSKLSSFFNPVPKQAKTSFDHAAPSNPTVLTDAVVNTTV